jgi:outer membrane receptor protein involved in Fe transport
MFRGFRIILPAALSLSSLSNAFAQSSDSAGTAAEAKGRGIEEVVVTAQKREEVLRDVPASISVLGGDQVENLSLNSLADFATYVPGFSVNSGGSPGLARITLRGIQTGGGGAPLVGMYINDTPVGSSRSPSSYILDLLPYDVQRIEVLRGPQGTLYGAGAMGGLVKYVLREADTHNFEARFGGTLESVANGDGPSWGSRGTVNVPLIDGVLAVRASGYYNDDAGYIDNIGIGVNNENTVTRKGGRLAFFYQPADNLEIIAAALFQDIDSGGKAVVQLHAVNDQPVVDRYTHSSSLPERLSQDLQFYSLTVNWDLGFGTVTSASSFSRTDNFSQFDYTPVYGRFCPVLSRGAVPPCRTDLPDSNKLDKFTQEVRISSPTEQTVAWMLGLFYTDEDGVNAQQVRALDTSDALIPSLNPLLDYYSPNTYKEKAVFGNVTYKLTERFDATVGARWANNRQVLRSTLVGPLVGADQIIRGESEDNVLTWMVSPRFHINDDSMVYGRVATGYRPGGPNSPLPEVPPQFDSDTTTNYEAGYKASVLDGALALDLAVFYIDWQDIQISARNANGINYRANGSKASSRGVEFTTSYQVTDHWRFGATGSYTNAKLEADVVSLGGKAGDRLPQSPRLTGSFTADYETRFGSTWLLQLGGGYRYFGSTFSAVESSPTAVRVPEQNIVDVYGGGTLDGRTSLRLYVRNVFNDRSYTNLNDTNTPGLPNFVPVQPRTIGVNLDIRF